MTESQVYLQTDKDSLLDILRLHKAQDWRLSQISATAKEGFDLLYSLEKEGEMTHLRVKLTQGEWITSVSGVYAYAYLYENEIEDLFGIGIHGMNVDFHGKLYQTSVKAPFAPETAQKEEEDTHG